MPELLSTARLQLHREFDFDAATAVVPYYASLGLSHLYLSPIAKAVPGSLHGYDVIDPTQVNPELGGGEGLRRLASALRSKKMGAIVDIVPNHMAASVANPWWRDVLADGPASRHAHYFDIDWHAPGAGGKLWLPILGEALADSVRLGRIRLDAGGEGEEPSLHCNGTPLPLSGSSMAGVLAMAGFPAAHRQGRSLSLSAWESARGSAAGRNRLEAVAMAINGNAARLLELAGLQHYRLAFWRTGNDAINYRRFFDIDTLAGLAVEHDDVFDAVHALPLRLIAEGLVDGLRVDHVDGLSKPAAYLQKLRNAVAGAQSQRPPDVPAAVTVHVEKILGHDESLRQDWPVEGTTGYEFMDRASAVMHDPQGERPLRCAWVSISERDGDFGQEQLWARREILGRQLYTEFQATLRAWWAVAESHGNGSDVTRHSLEQALSGLLEHMPVYRTYLRGSSPGEADRKILEQAFAGACAYPAAADALEQLRGWMLDGSPDAANKLQPMAQRRLEQTAAPLNAKAVEDTVFYRYGVLLSRNEVGSDPGVFSCSVDDFHRAMQQRARHWPRSLSATATHDHKRGEDTRARIAVISGRAAWFRDHAMRWIGRWNGHERVTAGVISPGDLWMLLQTMLGAWPLGLDAGDAAGMARFFERLNAWQEKALREAKLRTSWVDPDEDYERACRAPLHAWLLEEAFAGLRKELETAAHALDVPGALASLSMVVLRLTAPGIPDLYQGTEFWDQTLVDPDNRSPVDYEARRRGLTASGSPAELLSGFRDGRIKQWIIGRLLGLRQAHPGVFLAGNYRPLAVTGEFSDRILAFVREHEGQRCLVVVPRLCTDWLFDQPSPMVPPANWTDTTVWLGADDALCTFDDVFLHRGPSPGAALPVQQLLGAWPVAVLVSSSH